MIQNYQQSVTTFMYYVMSMLDWGCRKCWCLNNSKCFLLPIAQSIFFNHFHSPWDTYLYRGGRVYCPYFGLTHIHTQPDAPVNCQLELQTAMATHERTGGPRCIWKQHHLGQVRWVTETETDMETNREKKTGKGTWTDVETGSVLMSTFGFKKIKYTWPLPTPYQNVLLPFRLPLFSFQFFYFW